MRALLFFLCVFSFFSPFLKAQEFSFDAVVTTCQKFLCKLRQKNEQEAYYAFTSMAYKEAVSLKQFLQFVKANPSLQQNKELCIGKVVQNGQIGALEGMILDEKANALYIFFELEKEQKKFGITKITLLRPNYSFHLLPKRQIN
jgi:hypothetical protein